MIETVKQEHRPKAAQIYHQGLIKILVEYQVRSQGIAWRVFMIKNRFTEQIIEAQEKIEQENRSLMNSPFVSKNKS